MKPQNYRDFLERTFAKRLYRLEDVSETYKLVFDIKPKIILTTNFDDIPEKLNTGYINQSQNLQSSVTPYYKINSIQNVSSAISDLRSGQSMVFKMHGGIPDYDSLVFSLEDFRNVMFSREDLRSFLNAILIKCTVIYLGFSFTDPHMDLILSSLHEKNKSGIPHYVLINDFSDIQKDFMERKYEIRVISYTSSPGHPQVADFLRLFNIP
jgi:hypothetical protein